MVQIVKIKRSNTTAVPATLTKGELAYSSNSNKLFVGNPGDSSVDVVGGKLYVDMLDHAAGTLTNSSALIVDSAGKLDQLKVDNLTFNGNTIISTDTNGNINITPNGAGDVVLDGVKWPQADGTAGYLLSTNGSGQTSWTSVQGQNTTDNVTFNDVTVNGQLVTDDITAASITTSGNLIVTGDFTVNGTTTTVNTSTMIVEDPLMALAGGNNTNDAVDIGFYGLHDTTGSQDAYSGFFRDATDKKWKLFNDNQAVPDTTVNTGGTGYSIGSIVAHLEDSSVEITGGSITGITDLTVADGGTGRSSFTSNGILYGQAAGGLAATAAGTDGYILVSNSGTPTWASGVDGGTF
jgi:hypothetical protein